MRTLAQYRLAVLFVSLATAPFARAEPQEEKPITGEPITHGNVVVGGEFLTPPYRVTRISQKVLINDIPIASLAAPSHLANQVTAGEFVARIERSLFWGATLIVFDEQTRLVVSNMDARAFGESLSKAMTIEQKVQVIFEQADCDEFSQDCVPTAQWRAALENSNPTDALACSAEPGYLAACEQDGDTDAIEVRGPILVETCNLAWCMYVLNSSGMLLAVISLGVLINNPPKANVTWIETWQSPDAVRLVKRCLTLTVVLSVFDLVSTLTAASTGGFVESNPLAACLVDDPALLTSIKLFGTCLTTSLLWSQRKYVGVQLASWWICFVLTLVTIRWVVVDSLFYV